MKIVHTVEDVRAEVISVVEGHVKLLRIVGVDAEECLGTDVGVHDTSVDQGVSNLGILLGRIEVLKERISDIALGPDKHIVVLDRIGQGESTKLFLKVRIVLGVVVDDSDNLGGSDSLSISVKDDGGKDASTLGSVSLGSLTKNLTLRSPISSIASS